jgi:cytochrome c oxidase subunit 4
MKETVKSGPNSPGPSQGLYLAVWAGLLVLTALTVAVAGLHLKRGAVALALGIAAVKSCLVALYFMHLRWEKRLLIQLMLPITLATLAIFIGLTYTDILHR